MSVCSIVRSFIRVRTAFFVCVFCVCCLVCCSSVVAHLLMLLLLLLLCVFSARFVVRFRVVCLLCVFSARFVWSVSCWLLFCSSVLVLFCFLLVIRSRSLVCSRVLVRWSVGWLCVRSFLRFVFFVFLGLFDAFCFVCVFVSLPVFVGPVCDLVG